MNKFCVTKLLYLFLLFAAIPERLAGQIQLCTYDDPTCSSWSAHLFGVAKALGGGCRVNYTVETRECNGVREFRITNLEIVEETENNCAALLNLNVDELSLSALMDKIDMSIISRLGIGDNNHFDVPICPDAGQVIKIYSASCGIWVECAWELTSLSPDCDPGFAPVPETPIDNKVRTWHFRSCGYTCCKRTYTVCREVGVNPTAPDGMKYIHITQEVKGKVGDCTDQSNYGSNTCQDGC